MVWSRCLLCSLARLMPILSVCCLSMALCSSMSEATAYSQVLKGIMHQGRSHVGCSCQLHWGGLGRNQCLKVHSNNIYFWANQGLGFIPLFVFVSNCLVVLFSSIIIVVLLCWHITKWQSIFSSSFFFINYIIPQFEE